jgi:hypothetical protein
MVGVCCVGPPTLVKDRLAIPLNPVAKRTAIDSFNWVDEKRPPVPDRMTGALASEPTAPNRPVMYAHPRSKLGVANSTIDSPPTTCVQILYEALRKPTDPCSTSRDPLAGSATSYRAVLTAPESKLSLAHGSQCRHSQNSTIPCCKGLSTVNWIP